MHHLIHLIQMILKLQSTLKRQSLQTIQMSQLIQLIQLNRLILLTQSIHYFLLPLSVLKIHSNRSLLLVQKLPLTHLFRKNQSLRLPQTPQ
jgi:hypothetical protein